MEIKSHFHGQVAIINLAGRFDAYSAPQVSDHLEKLLNQTPPQIVVNLEEVVFVDSTALATLVQAMKRCRQLEGDLRLAHLKQPVRMIFELTRLDRAFEIFPDETEAADAFQPAEA
ncbi:MAG: STAS domain-containing protein [Ardenticatenaceae bacterium]|nr:STAS domain-containing protein [Ardenticatenaceae bacterium]